MRALTNEAAGDGGAYGQRFADIPVLDLEGFHALWEEHADAMRVAPAHHDELLLAAIEGTARRVR